MSVVVMIFSRKSAKWVGKCAVFGMPGKGREVGEGERKVRRDMSTIISQKTTSSLYIFELEICFCFYCKSLCFMIICISVCWQRSVPEIAEYCEYGFFCLKLYLFLKCSCIEWKLLKLMLKWFKTVLDTFWNIHQLICSVFFSFSALILLVGHQEEHPACKNWVPLNATPSGLSVPPPPSHAHFLRQMPFLPQPSQFILAWDRHRIMLACVPSCVPIRQSVVHKPDELCGTCLICGVCEIMHKTAIYAQNHAHA